MESNPKQILSSKELLKRLGHISQIASVKPYIMSYGRANGLKALQVSNGSGLDFILLESKCLDIAELKYKGTNLSFLAKPGLVSPEYYNPAEQEFSRSFQGGALFTCGLSNVGTACTDNTIYYSPHGRIGHTPADKVNVVSDWHEDEYQIQISGEMRQSALFSENLVLKRRITSKLYSKAINIHDEVENQGFQVQPLMLLYHFNLGYPLLDEGAEFVLPGIEVIPRDAEAAKGLADYYNFSTPIDEYNEQVFYHKVNCDQNGNSTVGLINERINLGVYIRYNTLQLPHLIQWKSMGSGDYALGIEPATCLVEGRVKEKERGFRIELAPSDKSVFDLEIGVLDGIEEINTYKKEVENLKINRRNQKC